MPPPDQALSWKAWHEVLRDRSRNFLFNYLGRGEDNVQTGLRPDCADFAYFLRAYFAYKMGLPFGYSKCSRGGHGQPPKCYSWWSIQNAEPEKRPEPVGNGLVATLARPASITSPPPRLGLAASFGHYLPIIADGVHSGSARTP